MAVTFDDYIAALKDTYADRLSGLGGVVTEAMQCAAIRAGLQEAKRLAPLHYARFTVGSLTLGRATVASTIANSVVVAEDLDPDTTIGAIFMLFCLRAMALSAAQAMAEANPGSVAGPAMSVSGGDRAAQHRQNARDLLTEINAALAGLAASGQTIGATFAYRDVIT